MRRMSHSNFIFSVLHVYVIISWWRHQMETFSALLAICAGNSPVTGEFPSQMASNAELWCFLWSAPWINSWINNGEAGYLRRHRAHYDVIVMLEFGTPKALLLKRQYRSVCGFLRVFLDRLVTCDFRRIRRLVTKTRAYNRPTHSWFIPKKNPEVLHEDVTTMIWTPLLWRHNGRDGVSNHQPHHCLLNRLFRRRSKKTSKRRAGNSPVTGEFSANGQ